MAMALHSITAYMCCISLIAYTCRNRIHLFSPKNQRSQSCSLVTRATAYRVGPSTIDITAVIAIVIEVDQNSRTLQPVRDLRSSSSAEPYLSSTA